MAHGTASTKMSVSQFREFSGAVLRSLPDDLEETVVQGWIENQESLRKVLREALAPNGEPVTSVGPTYPVTINYGLTLEEMIAAGRYYWKNDDITAKHFPVKGEGTKEVVTKLIHFNKYMESDDVLRELDQRGLRPATIEELLAFGAKYPELQRQFPIVALGSVWRRLGYRHVPYLWGHAFERNLYLFWFESRWRGPFRFLALRK